MRAQHLGMGVYKYGHGLLFEAGSPEEAKVFMKQYLNHITERLKQKVREAIGPVNSKHN